MPTWFPESFVYRASDCRSTPLRSATVATRVCDAVTVSPTASDSSAATWVSETTIDGARAGWRSICSP